MPTLVEVQQFNFRELAAPVSTLIIADNDVAPTNWQAVDTLTVANALGNPGTVYSVRASFQWWMDSVLRSGLFRLVINGVSNDRSMVEPKDRQETHYESYRQIITNHNADGPLTIELQYLISDDGTGTTELHVTRAELTLERKIE